MFPKVTDSLVTAPSGIAALRCVDDREMKTQLLHTGCQVGVPAHVEFQQQRARDPWHDCALSCPRGVCVCACALAESIDTCARPHVLVSQGCVALSHVQEATRTAKVHRTIVWHGQVDFERACPQAMCTAALRQGALPRKVLHDVQVLTAHAGARLRD